MVGEPEFEPAHPVLYLTKTWLFTWEQHRPGGCRCVCALYHRGSGTCSAAAEPGHLLRVVTPGIEQHSSPADIADPLPVCAPCYTALAPLSTPPAAAAE